MRITSASGALTAIRPVTVMRQRMIEIAPDVNKIKDGSDSELCWAAACSNALAYTEWGDIDPYNIYEKFLKYNKNE